MAGQKQGSGGISLPPRAALAAVGGVLLVVAALVLIRVAGGGKSDSSSTSTAASAPATTATAPVGQSAAGIAQAVAAVPPTTLAKVGDGDIKPLTRIQGPPLRAGGKPLVLYVGGEFCPFCAAERWPLINALSRFGKLQGLGFTTSSSSDVYPDTPTFTFNGATYTSPTVALQALEVRDRDGNQLELPTATQQALIAKYDAPPYVSSNGGIPFLLIGGRYVLSGSQFSPQLLAGLSQADIAERIANASTTESRSVLGSANWLTAAICDVNGGKPASTCDTSLMRSLIKRQRSAGG
jgi:hypothetical protein